VNKTLCVLLVFWVTGCVSVERDYYETSAVVEKAMPILQYDETPVTGSIYRDQARSSKFGFLKNFSLGDILTVVLNESTQAQRSNGINTAKEVSNSPLSQLAAAFGAGLPIGRGSSSSTDKEILVKRGLKALTFTEQNRSDKGVGSSDQAGSLNGALAVIVTRILPNGTLFVEGKKNLLFSEGQEEVYVSGLVMPADVQPDNTVLSSRIAQANISYQGRGDLADVARTSWGTKVFNKYWPF
jgi:flagellar L-ring protein precursor FlgH